MLKLKRLSKDKQGQHTLGLPFGVIFSIFLIVVFIGIAIIAVNYFLDVGSCSSVGLFYEELQKEVNNVWASQESSSELEINLPSKIEKVCFANLSAEIKTGENQEILDAYDEISIYKGQGANIFLIPPGKACEMGYNKINHIDIGEITENENPYCIDLDERNKLRLEKGFYDKFVVVR